MMMNVSGASDWRIHSIVFASRSMLFNTWSILSSVSIAIYNQIVFRHGDDEFFDWGVFVLPPPPNMREKKPPPLDLLLFGAQPLQRQPLLQQAVYNWFISSRFLCRCCLDFFSRPLLQHIVILHESEHFQFRYPAKHHQVHIVFLSQRA